jgi:hypothetical protein
VKVNESAPFWEVEGGTARKTSSLAVAFVRATMSPTSKSISKDPNAKFGDEDSFVERELRREKRATTLQTTAEK